MTGPVLLGICAWVPGVAERVLRERFWRAVDGVLLMSLLLYLSPPPVPADGALRVALPALQVSVDDAVQGRHDEVDVERGGLDHP